MDMQQFLENKSVLVTGSTGFLAKIFVEKLLRTQPNVKKLYLLIRAADTSSAYQRFYNEVVEKDLFKVVKEKLCASLDIVIAEKICIIPGDVCYENLGIKDSSLREEMIKDLDFVLNFAATTTFDERYDVALDTNTIGAKNVVCFAQTCLNLKLLVHVSTAYVCGESSGLIREKPLVFGEAMNGALGLNIEEEMKLVDHKLNQLKNDGASEANIKEALKDLGTSRAKRYGWPNTYVFTKAMGEMILQNLKENLPVITIRPAMVTSTYKEPFPGWIEGARTIDALTVAYGTGKLQFFVVDLAGIVDLIPGDMVVNAIIVAMMRHSNNNEFCEKIYHIGSSSRNPVRYSNLKDSLYCYFKNKPWILRNGKSVKVVQPTIFTNIPSFHRYIAIHYRPVLKGLKVADKLCCHYLQGTYSKLNRNINLLIRLVELYKPYLFFQGIFDDSNTNELLMVAKENGVEADLFFFDCKSIEWNDYFMNIHIPGVVKYVFKK